MTFISSRCSLPKAVLQPSGIIDSPLYLTVGRVSVIYKLICIAKKLFFDFIDPQNIFPEGFGFVCRVLAEIKGPFVLLFQKWGFPWPPAIKFFLVWCLAYIWAEAVTQAFFRSTLALLMSCQVISNALHQALKIGSEFLLTPNPERFLTGLWAVNLLIVLQTVKPGMPRSQDVAFSLWNCTLYWAAAVGVNSFTDFCQTALAGLAKSTQNPLLSEWLTPIVETQTKSESPPAVSSDHLLCNDEFQGISQYSPAVQEP